MPPDSRLHTSRNVLVRLHTNILDMNAMDVLTTAYHTLTLATLSTRPPKHALTATGFAQFILSVLQALPSSSTSGSTVGSSSVAVFAEVFIDLVWTFDSELDEVLADAKAIIAAAGQPEGGQQDAQVPTELKQALDMKQRAEKDKEALAMILKQLLVSDHWPRQNVYLTFL
jgi:THO complex subunit 2